MAANPFAALRGARCELAWGRSRLWWQMCGPCSFAVTYRNGLHQHSRYFEICAMLAGRGIQTHTDQTVDLKPGDLFLARPGVVHEIISEKSPAIELVFFNLGVIDFQPQDPSVEGRLLRRFLESNLIHSRGGDVVERQLLTLARSLEERAADQDLALELGVRALAGEVMRRMCSPTHGDEGPASAAAAALAGAAGISPAIEAALTAVPLSQPAAQGPNPALEQALRFLDDNLARPISCAELARQSGLSERTLRRLFEEHLHSTPGAEYLKRRMRFAAHLLNDPKRSIHAVGAEIGIPDPSQFSRDFRRVMGQTPTQYRQMRTKHVTFPQAHLE